MGHYSRITSRYVREVVCARLSTGLLFTRDERLALAFALRTAQAADRGQRPAVDALPRIFRSLKQSRDEDRRYARDDDTCFRDRWQVAVPLVRLFA